jgi:hypothetical protein
VANKNFVRRCLAVFVVWLWFVAGDLGASSCPRLTFEQKVERAELIFSGRVVEVWPSYRLSSGILALQATFEVHTWWKGDRGSRVSIYDIATSSAAGLRRGQSYLVFADDSSGSLRSYTSWCAGTVAWPPDGVLLEALDAGREIPRSSGSAPPEGFLHLLGRRLLFAVFTGSLFILDRWQWASPELRFGVSISAWLLGLLLVAIVGWLLYRRRWRRALIAFTTPLLAVIAAVALIWCWRYWRYAPEPWARAFID